MDKRTVFIVFPQRALDSTAVGQAGRRYFTLEGDDVTPAGLIDLKHPWIADPIYPISYDDKRRLVIAYKEEAMGTFDGIEAALRRANIPYDSYDFGDVDHDPAAIHFWRPGFPKNLVVRPIADRGTMTPVIAFDTFEHTPWSEIEHIRQLTAHQDVHGFEIEWVNKASRQALAPWIHRLMPLQ